MSVTPVTAAALCGCGSGLSAPRCCAVPATWVATSAEEGRAAAFAHLAEAAFGQGQTTLAEQHCLDALERWPFHPGALWLLHTLRRAEGRTDAGIALLRRLVAVEPNSVPVTLALAGQLFERTQLIEAEHHARNAVRLAPTDLRSHNILAMVLTEAQRPHVGEFHYRRVLALSGVRDPILLANLAWNLKAQGRFDEARRLYAESVALAPDVFQTWLGWGQLEEADGAFDAAATKFDRAALLRPEASELRFARGRLSARRGDHDAALRALDQPLDVEQTGPDSAELIDPYALLERGRLLDKLGRFEEAFRHFDEGKRLARTRTGQTYLEDHVTQLASRLKTFFVERRCRLIEPAPRRDDTGQPIFILGFPRSGTTLLEQALSRHPNIMAGDELPFIADLAEELPRLLGSPLQYPEALSELWMGDKSGGLLAIRDAYLHRAARRGLQTRPGTYFTDKMPLNEMHLGLIALALPEAPMIHVVRHPLDVVLSVYSHHLTHGYFCASRLEAIARHYLLMMELVEHYRRELPARYVELRYEDLVEDMPAALRRVLDFIGEPYDARCAEFQKNRRRPQTPSYSQVTEPIHDRSRFRHRHYLRQLEPAVTILAPLIEKLGYPVLGPHEVCSAGLDRRGAGAAVNTQGPVDGVGVDLHRALGQM